MGVRKKNFKVIGAESTASTDANPFRGPRGVAQPTADIDFGARFRQVFSSVLVSVVTLANIFAPRLFERKAKTKGFNKMHYRRRLDLFRTSVAMTRADLRELANQPKHANVNEVLKCCDNQRLAEDHVNERALTRGVGTKGLTTSKLHHS